MYLPVNVAVRPLGHFIALMPMLYTPYILLYRMHRMMCTTSVHPIGGYHIHQTAIRCCALVSAKSSYFQPTRRPSTDLRFPSSICQHCLLYSRLHLEPANDGCDFAEITEPFSCSVRNPSVAHVRFNAESVCVCANRGDRGSSGTLVPIYLRSMEKKWR